ncbi:MAG: hypothetical protein K9I69_06710 [Ignavibacteriales bacterium]|nr:hypothetical protein [Ignavibacteriales bacterium]MCF8305565.1 hypothetical protein [Ignavibacteriales bacterium]MCF8315287.1 hypothetical protein [Ignavibacteriales bacterium]MCF8436821.1 hypothetical protein [Ignavibacteriales bacterium]
MKYFRAILILNSIFIFVNCGQIWKTYTADSEKILFNLEQFNNEGLLGTSHLELRSMDYEFCIPDLPECRDEVKQIDTTLQFFTDSPGRSGCGKGTILCIGNTHRPDFRESLLALAALPYITEIKEVFYE